LWLSVAWLTLMSAAALSADLLPLAPYSRPVGPFRAGPFEDLREPLGLDQIGRSILTRCIYGGRVALAVGLLSTLIALVIGGTVGLMAGVGRRSVNFVVDALSDVILTFPPLVLLLALSAVMDPSITTLVVGLAVVLTPTMAKVVRAQARACAKQDYVMVALSLGATRRRIMWREIAPNVFPAALSYALVAAGLAITAEGSLSFLNLGVPSPHPSWGGMIYASKDEVGTNPHLVAFPALCLFLTVYSVTTLGEHVRARIEGRDERPREER
jgi:peptide/nickel transport system permease protein